jgi:hypothetical protein
VKQTLTPQTRPQNQRGNHPSHGCGHPFSERLISVDTSNCLHTLLVMLVPLDHATVLQSAGAILNTSFGAGSHVGTPCVRKLAGVGLSGLMGEHDR